MTTSYFQPCSSCDQDFEPGVEELEQSVKVNLFSKFELHKGEHTHTQQKDFKILVNFSKISPSI